MPVTGKVVFQRVYDYYYVHYCYLRLDALDDDDIKRDHFKKKMMKNDRSQCECTGR
jgi:hypothetical protein